MMQPTENDYLLYSINLSHINERIIVEMERLNDIDPYKQSHVPILLAGLWQRIIGDLLGKGFLLDKSWSTRLLRRSFSQDAIDELAELFTHELCDQISNIVGNTIMEYPIGYELLTSEILCIAIDVREFEKKEDEDGTDDDVELLPDLSCNNPETS